MIEQAKSKLEEKRAYLAKVKAERLQYEEELERLGQTEEQLRKDRE